MQRADECEIHDLSHSFMVESSRYESHLFGSSPQTLRSHSFLSSFAQAGGKTFRVRKFGPIDVSEWPRNGRLHKSYSCACWEWSFLSTKYGFPLHAVPSNANTPRTFLCLWFVSTDVTPNHRRTSFQILQASLCSL